MHVVRLAGIVFLKIAHQMSQSIYRQGGGRLRHGTTVDCCCHLSTVREVGPTGSVQEGEVTPCGFLHHYREELLCRSQRCFHSGLRLPDFESFDYLRAEMAVYPANESVNFDSDCVFI